jgi:hypothetical protein
VAGLAVLFEQRENVFVEHRHGGICPIVTVRDRRRRDQDKRNCEHGPHVDCTLF